jgi:hypothetical protein
VIAFDDTQAASRSGPAHGVIDFRDIGQNHRRAVVVSDDQRSIPIGLQKLIGVESEGWKLREHAFVEHRNCPRIADVSF